MQRPAFDPPQGHFLLRPPPQKKKKSKKSSMGINEIWPKKNLSMFKNSTKEGAEIETD